MRSPILRCFACAVVALMLSACSNGMDKPLVTDNDIDSFNASLTAARKEMTPKDIEAFEWAVSDLSLEVVNARYPNQSARQIVRGEAKYVLAKAPPQIAALEKELATWTRDVAEINKVVATEVSFSLEKDFFGLQPRINATVYNGSKYGYSMLSWRAELYLNGAKSPVAVSEQLDLFTSTGGLAPGARARRMMTVGYVRGEQTWTTLEIQKATERVVKLTLIPSEATDFGERNLIGTAPAEELDKLKDTLATATNLKDY